MHFGQAQANEVGAGSPRARVSGRSSAAAWRRVSCPLGGPLPGRARGVASCFANGLVLRGRPASACPAALRPRRPVGERRRARVQAADDRERYARGRRRSRPGCLVARPSGSGRRRCAAQERADLPLPSVRGRAGARRAPAPRLPQDPGDGVDVVVGGGLGGDRVRVAAPVHDPRADEPERKAGDDEYGEKLRGGDADDLENPARRTDGVCAGVIGATELRP